MSYTKAIAANPYHTRDALDAANQPPHPLTGRLPEPESKLSGSASWSAGSLTDGSSATTTVTVNGAVSTLSNRVAVLLSPAPPSGVSAYGYVSAANTVTVVAQNRSGATVGAATYAVTAEVWPNQLPDR